MQQLYFAAILAEGNIRIDAEALKRELSERFSTKAALKSPAHITLFPPFHFDPANETELHQAIKASAKEMHRFDLTLDGFAAFAEQTIFIQVAGNEMLNRLYEKVQAAFESVPGTGLKRDPRPFHPHMTIGNRDWKPGEFADAFSDFSKREFAASMPVHQISLLRLVNGKWEIVFQQEF